MNIVIQTHQVSNQSPIYSIDRNLFSEDPILQSWIQESIVQSKIKKSKKNY